MQSNPEYLLTKGQLIYCRSKWKAVEADKCQLSSGQGEPDICLVTIMAVGITQLQLCSAREIEMMETCKCRKAVSISCTTGKAVSSVDSGNIVSNSHNHY